MRNAPTIVFDLKEGKESREQILCTDGFPNRPKTVGDHGRLVTDG